MTQFAPGVRSVTRPWVKISSFMVVGGGWRDELKRRYCLPSTIRHLITASSQIVPFHKDFSPSGEQLELRKLAHEL